MKSTMSFKGYNGSVEFSDDDGIFYGTILGITDHIVFDGYSVDELRKNFQDAVDGYLDICSTMGKTPDKAYKGTFNVRITPALHRELAVYSSSHGKTLNSTVEEAIRNHIDH